MSRAIEINGIEFITTREAAKVADYSNDYISKLAREGKVKGMQLGRQWFVDPTSLENFLEQTKVEKTVRSQSLRRERASERVIREEKKNASESVKRKGSLVRPATMAALQAFLVLSAGILAGGAFLLSNNLAAELATDSRNDVVSQSQFAQVSARDAETEAPAATTVLSDTADEVSSSARVATSGYLLLAHGATQEDAMQLEGMFSDEVSIEFADDHSGTVTPKFRDHDGTGVRFIEVPVKRVTN